MNKLEPSEWKHNVAPFAALKAKVWAGHREKRPVQFGSEKNASSSNPATWGDYAQAARHYEKVQTQPKSGVGLMMSKVAGLVALDFDHALGEDGLPLPWCQPYVERLVAAGCYIERSPSGRGLHAFWKGSSLPGERSQAVVYFLADGTPTSTKKGSAGAVEAFSEPRFVTLTGDVYMECRTLGEGGDFAEALADVLKMTGLDLKLMAPANKPDEVSGKEDVADLPVATQALEQINPDCDRQTWMECGMAMKAAFGAAGWAPWAEWSAGGHATYNGADCKMVWASFGKSGKTGITLGTLYHHAKEASGGEWSPPAPRGATAAEDFAEFTPKDSDGHELDPDEPTLEEKEGYPIGSVKDWGKVGLHLKMSGSGKTAALAPSEGEVNVGLYLQNHERWKGKLRFNERTMEVEFGDEGEHFNAKEATRAVTFFCDWRRSPSVQMVDKVARQIAMDRRFDPVKDWLESLKWDGVERLNKLCATVGLEDDDYTRRCVRRWMIGAVARAMRPGCEMQNMLILHGEQGKKKSAFFKRLAVRPEWYSESHVDMSSKDGQLQLLGPWIVEVGELTGMSKSDVEKVKLFISESHSRFRAPYESKAQSYPRRVVMCGTINGEEFLRDGTGSRRFWSVGVREEGDLSIGALTDEVVSQLWAEAHVAVESDERWWDAGDEVRATNRRNEEHYQRTGLDEQVATILAEVKSMGITSGAVLRALMRDHGTHPGTKISDVGAAMKRLGWVATRIRPGGKHGGYPTIFRRPGTPSPGEDEKAREALLLSFRLSTPKSEFSQEGEAKP